MSSGGVVEMLIYSAKLAAMSLFAAGLFVSCAIEACGRRKSWMRGEYIVFGSFRRTS
jgi:hypothetical protein